MRLHTFSREAEKNREYNRILNETFESSSVENGDGKPSTADLTLEFDSTYE